MLYQHAVKAGVVMVHGGADKRKILCRGGWRRGGEALLGVEGEGVQGVVGEVVVVGAAVVTSGVVSREGGRGEGWRG